MCKYISGEFVMPGWGCCNCNTYNGLQRKECKFCDTPRHGVVVPENVVVCSDCGFGDDGHMKFCPICGSVLIRKDGPEPRDPGRGGHGDQAPS